MARYICEREGLCQILDGLMRQAAIDCVRPAIDAEYEPILFMMNQREDQKEVCLKPDMPHLAVSHYVCTSLGQYSTCLLQ